jgi:hypothetical protein
MTWWAIQQYCKPRRPSHVDAQVEDCLNIYGAILPTHLVCLVDCHLILYYKIEDYHGPVNMIDTTARILMASGVTYLLIGGVAHTESDVRVWLLDNFLDQGSLLLFLRLQTPALIKPTTTLTVGRIHSYYLLCKLVSNNVIIIIIIIIDITRQIYMFAVHQWHPYYHEGLEKPGWKPCHVGSDDMLSRQCAMRL